MNDLISVIIPVYNSERFLKKCFDSICSSVYEALEIIVINDGSTDRSGEMCDRIARVDSRVRVFHRANSGVSNSRNYGLSHATGAYIAFVDSDDYVEPDYFQRLLEAINCGDVDLAIGSVAHVYHDVVQCEMIDECMVDFEHPGSGERKAFYELNSKYFLYGPCNKLYKKDIIVEGGVSFPEDTAYGEDLLFNFDYLNLCKRIAYRKKPVYYYNHDNEESLSHQYRENLFENGLRLNDKLMSFSRSHNLLSEEMATYCAHRVFDDAYNSLFDVWNSQCKLTLLEKYRRTKMIMGHKRVREALPLGNYESYSQVYVKMIQKKQAVRFSLIRCFGPKVKALIGR